MNQEYADIILPFSVRGRFTYRIPGKLESRLAPGMRVKVDFSGRISPGIVFRIHDLKPDHDKIKEVIDIFDKVPVINDKQLKLWKWISDYYMCTEGEVMKAGLLPEKSLDDYKQRTEVYVKLIKDFSEARLNNILDNLRKAPKQYEMLASWIRLSDYPGHHSLVRKADLLKESGCSGIILDNLIKKEVLETILIPSSEPGIEKITTEPPYPLSPAQQTAINKIRDHFLKKEIVLLHGVTSSGKTEIYIHLIEEQLKLGKQVLYLLPEIALTTQIILRLKKHFGSSTEVYHSRLNDRERIEIWNKVASSGKSGQLILGVRSSVFLPFSRLSLIIIDEEHDGSYKQQDPAPRYNGRDTAIMLANIHGAKTILGSASPSIESYNNALSGKYGIVELNERYSQIRLPDIIIANTREAYRRKLMVSHFTPELLNAVDDALSKEEQVILFQNRRGYSPYLECSECGWIPVCVQCAVNLTYHKGINRLVCHYCGYTTLLPHNCGSCNSAGLVTKGFGTEKIEDEIRLVFPKARVARMDQDTTRSKNAFNKIIKSFENRQIDILIGTQMISKGLDFENLTIVGILNADNLLNFPDFRSHERSFQLMEQVSGRAGRRNKPGKVIIQTSDPSHKIIRQVIQHDYKSMFRVQADERMTFNYPPFCRMIRMSIKHKNRGQLAIFAEKLGVELKRIFGKRVLGPEEPLISRVQLWYIKVIILKIEKERSMHQARSLIYEAMEHIDAEKGASSLRISVDVDPY